MPNGHAHSAATVVVSLFGGTVAYTLAGNAEFAGWVAAGSALTLLVNPDTDQEGMDRNEHRLVRNTLGCGFVWLAVWYPYAVMFRHRGLSHVPIIGTLTRVGYIFAVLAALWLAADTFTSTMGLYSARFDVNPEWVAMATSGVIVGMSISDLLHWLMDGMAI